MLLFSESTSDKAKLKMHFWCFVYCLYIHTPRTSVLIECSHWQPSLSRDGQFRQILYLKCTVVILINSTTLMHKSTLSTNNFGNNHFGQKCQKQNILRIFRRLLWFCLKNFQRIEQKLENTFLANFSILLTIS